jgi:hypothetical protein
VEVVKTMPRRGRRAPRASPTRRRGRGECSSGRLVSFAAACEPVPGLTRAVRPRVARSQPGTRSAQSTRPRSFRPNSRRAQGVARQMGVGPAGCWLGAGGERADSRSA